MKFASREEAGCRLGKFLRERGVVADFVLGLPRGGVVVAAEVARELKLPLDVLVVRKIGHPLQREFAVGALAEPDIVLLDEATLLKIPAPRAELDRVISDEMARLREHCRRFHLFERPQLAGKTILLADDGLATGATAAAAALSAKNQGAQRVIVAAPAASVDAVQRLKRASAGVVALIVDPGFEAVGGYYDKFLQTGDEEVIALLRAAGRRAGRNPFDAADGGL